MKQHNYAFIDSQNLNLGVRSLGWQIDYRKLRLYLKNKYHVQKAYIFIGFIENNQVLYNSLQSAGFILVFKPTTSYLENQKITTKGNVDAEIVLYAAAKEYNNYDKAIIISGDGDFYCLAEYLQENDKLLKIIVPNSKYSKLLKPFTKYIVRLDQLKFRLSYNKKSALAVGRNLRLSRNQPRSSGRSKP